MNAGLFSEAMGELDVSYSEEAIRFRKSAGARARVRLAVCAACLVLVIGAGVFALGRGQSEIPLSSHYVGVSVR